MSAGAFETGKYETTQTPTAILPITVQPETKALVINGSANAYPAGAIDGFPSAQVSKGARSIGVNARTVTIKFTGGVPTGYKQNSPITLPWFVQATFTPLVKGMTGTYLENDIELVGKRNEKVR
jgi:hypothetical protein